MTELLTNNMAPMMFGALVILPALLSIMRERDAQRKTQENRVEAEVHSLM